MALLAKSDYDNVRHGVVVPTKAILPLNQKNGSQNSRLVEAAAKMKTSAAFDCFAGLI